MVVTPLRVLLFVVAALLAAAGTAYVAGGFDSYLGRQAAPVAKAPDGEAGGKTARLGAPSENESDDTAADAASENAAETATEVKPDVVVPSFDVVRVEPNGSIVIAGKAAPNANVEVVAGATMIGKAQSGPEGDFAIVLDEPLDPGDYQLVLRSTAQDGIAATSTETAVVSVPEEEGGQVLALVEQPGEASKLITVPEPSRNDNQAAAGEPAARENDTAAPEAGNRESAGTASGEAIVTDPQGGDTKDRPASQADAGMADSKNGARTESGPTAGADGEKVAGAPEQADESTSQEQDVAAMPQPDAAGEASPQGSSEVFIEAVEIDGKQVFVAGNAEPDSRVRVYANDILLGEAKAAPTGRFLVETIRDLPVGDYIVRADVLAENGTDVAARAAVPFRREPGQSIAAVAPALRDGPQAKGDLGSATGTDSDAAGKDGRPASDAARKDSGSATASGAASQPTDDMTAGEAAGGSAVPGEGQQVRGVDTPESTSADEAAMAPQLEPVDGAVIIRRGDTLWHISRRVYGRGIRYTTIYLANQQQIRNPDLIWPGQVFTVPEETDEGEAADMKAIGDQAVPAPQR